MCFEGVYDPLSAVVCHFLNGLSAYLLLRGGSAEKKKHIACTTWYFEHFPGCKLNLPPLSVVLSVSFLSVNWYVCSSTALKGCLLPSHTGLCSCLFPLLGECNHPQHSHHSLHLRTRSPFPPRFFFLLFFLFQGSTL